MYSKAVVSSKPLRLKSKTRLEWAARLIVLFLLLCLSRRARALDRQPGADYRARRVALSKQLNGGVALLFAAVEPEGPDSLFGFRQDNDFFYLTGWDEPGAAVLISPAVAATKETVARTYTEILFLPSREREKELWRGPKLAPEDPKAPAITGFDHVAALEQIHDRLLPLKPEEVFTEIGEAPASTPSSIPMEWLKRSNSFPDNTTFQDISEAIGQMRRHKDRGEIERIRHATEASMAGHRAAMQAMHPGLYEYQIAALMQYKFEDAGCARPAYAPVVGSGFNSTVLHYTENSRRIEDGDIVLIDVAGEYGMYASDITRTLPANGHFTARQREIYNIVLGAQQAAMRAVVAGRSTLNWGKDSLYKVANDYIDSHGKDLHGASLGRYFTHGLGHRVGLEVHDVGSGPLNKGDVFTIEPGIYIPEEKLGVRLEDILMLDENGKLVNLTADLPHTAEEVEAAMRR
jgi:Xaa-Pro aminopeptidase